MIFPNAAGDLPSFADATEDWWTTWIEIPEDERGSMRTYTIRDVVGEGADTRLVVDSTVTTPKRAHENNVIGTMNILAACSGEDSCVRRLIVKSSAHYYGAEQDDPAFFTEEKTTLHDMIAGTRVVDVY